MDVDGPGAKFTAPLLALLRQHDPTTPLESEIRFHDYIHLQFTPKLRKLTYKILKDYKWWAAQPPEDGAQEAIALIRSHGHEIAWCTSPWESCFGWDQARRDWIRKHFNAKDDPIMTGTKKHVVHGQVMVDDRPDNLASWSKAHPQSTTFLYAVTGNIEHPFRYTWTDGLAHLVLDALEKS